jgi:phage-related protein
VKVTFAAASSGRSYFEKFIQDLSTQDRVVILAVFQDIQGHGLEAKGCEFRQIEGKLWEVKVRAQTGGYRFFYVLLAADHMHVLHSYRKQGQKAPPRELEMARKRLKEALDEK